MRERHEQRQSRRDQRIAARLQQLKAEEDIMKENRLQRQQDALKRRERDFAAALDREVRVHNVVTGNKDICHFLSSVLFSMNIPFLFVSILEFEFYLPFEPI